MLNRIGLAIALAFLPLVAWAQSPGPSQTPPKLSQPKQAERTSPEQATNSEKRGTANSPLVVKILTTIKTDTEPHQNEQDRFEKSANDGELVIFTGLLVVVGFLQFISISVQAIFLWRAFRESQKAGVIAETAANAAKKSADALIAAQRAYVFVKNFVQIELRDAQGNVTGWHCVVAWENSGSTPTKELKSYISWQLFDNAVSKAFDFKDIIAEGTPYPGAGFIGPRAQMLTTAFTLSIAHVIDMMNGVKFLYIWGWAEYYDIFPATPIHRTEFCNQVVGIPVAGNPNAARIDFRHHESGNFAT